MKLTTVVTLLAALVLRAPGAQAKGDNAGDLGSGGRVKGDISRDAGETDRVTVALDQGAVVTIRFSSSFTGHLAVSGPDGAPVDLGAEDGSRVLVTNRPIETGGRYELAISSTDGSQGLYSLVVKQRWPRSLKATGTGRQVVDVAMPAQGKLACVVRAAPGSAGRPEIVAIEDPANAELLASAIVATRSAARLAPTATGTAGIYHLTIDATDETSAWNATVTRSAPALAATSVNLTNGLDPVSFRDDGVGAFFVRRCSQCHGWATSYDGVRANLDRALGRISGRSMPPGGGLSDREIALVFAWVKTGKAR